MTDFSNRHNDMLKEQNLKNLPTPNINLLGDFYIHIAKLMREWDFQLLKVDKDSIKKIWRDLTIKPVYQTKFGREQIINSIKENSHYTENEIRDAFISVIPKLTALEFRAESIIEIFDTTTTDQRETTSFVDKDIIAEQVLLPDGPCFAIYKDGQISYAKEIKGSKIMPVRDKAIIEHGLVKFPGKPIDYIDVQDLIKEIREHIHKYLDISPDYEVFASFYILLSWVYDRFHTLPYLRALGDTGTGKSRFLNVIGGLCFKPTKISGAVTPAPIYRVNQKIKGTMIIDEADFNQSDEKSEIITILNCGFEKGTPVIRCLKDKPDELQVFDVFSPKIISTRQRFKDQALESRCLTEVLTQTRRKEIPVVLTDEYYEEQEKLRNKLLMFRFTNFYKFKQEKIELDIEIEPRLKQIVMSFIAMLKEFPIIYESFKKFILESARSITN